MRQAADLLAANALSVDQVALNAGYQSRSSFTRTFRRYYGSDPSEYRARAQRASSQCIPLAEDAPEESDAA
jgi:AraC family transcriptional activator of mtrCDE